MRRISRKQKLAAVATSLAVVAGVGAAYAFVVNPNQNTARVTLATTAQLAYVEPVGDNLQLQPGETNQIMVRVHNTTDQPIVVNGIAGGENDVVDPPGNGQAVAGDYCPGGSITVPDIGVRQKGATVATLTPLDPSGATWANPSDVSTTEIPSQDSAVFLMAVSFNDLAPTSGDDAAHDPNNQTGCLVGNGTGSNQSYTIPLGTLYYTAH